MRGCVQPAEKPVRVVGRALRKRADARTQSRRSLERCAALRRPAKLAAAAAEGPVGPWGVRCALGPSGGGELLLSELSEASRVAPAARCARFVARLRRPLTPLASTVLGCHGLCSGPFDRHVCGAGGAGLGATEERFIADRLGGLEGSALRHRPHYDRCGRVGRLGTTRERRRPRYKALVTGRTNQFRVCS